MEIQIHIDEFFMKARQSIFVSLSTQIMAEDMISEVFDYILLKS